MTNSPTFNKAEWNTPHSYDMKTIILSPINVLKYGTTRSI